MYRRLLFLLSLLAIAGCQTTEQAETTAPKPSSSELSTRAEPTKLSRDALMAALATATAPGAEPEAAGILLAAVVSGLETDLALSDRLYHLRMLELFGGEEVLSPLKKYAQSAHPHVRDAALRALAANPSPMSSVILRENFAASSPSGRRQIMDVMAYRGDLEAVELIVESLQDGDASVQEAAALALGKLDASKALPALMAAREQTAPASRNNFDAAILDLGLNAETAETLALEATNPSIRNGAYDWLLSESPDTAIGVLETLMQRGDTMGRSRLLRSTILRGPTSVRRALLSGLGDFSLDEQVSMIEAVGTAKLGEYEEELLALVPEAGEELKAVLVSVLSEIGGDASYAALYAAFVESPRDRVIAQAVASLRSSFADEQALALAVGSGDPSERVSAIQVLALRNSPGATEGLNAILAQSGDETVREAAMRALEQIGDLESVRTLAKLITDGDPSARRAQVSLKRLTLNFNAPDFLWEEVYAKALANASTLKAREDLIAILDGLGNTPSLKYLSPFMRDREHPLHKAASRALARWTFPNAGELWIEDVLKNHPSSSEIEDAQRAIIRLLSSEQVGGDAIDKMQLAVQAVQAAPSAAFKRAILDVYDRRLNGWEARSIADIFAPLLSDPEVADLVKKILS